MQHHSRVFCLLALMGAILPALSGCSDSSSPRSVLEVVSINANQSLKSDVVTMLNGEPSIFEDTVPVEIHNRPHDSILNLADGPYGTVFIDRYEIRFDAGDEVIPGVSGGLGWRVPANETIQGSLVVVPGRHKMMAPLVGLSSQGGEILSTAHITFFGRESTSNQQVTFETVMPIHFANWAD